MTPFGTLSLGELIELLKRREGDQRVCFDFCDLCVAGIDSYRGFYDHLALDYCEFPESPFQTVDAVLKLLRAANGQTYTGYKGGNFKMTLDTPVWVSEWGQASSTTIIGLHDDCEYSVVLKTEWQPI